MTKDNEKDDNDGNIIKS